MHPDKGPIVFTTQDKLFTHFAEEHASPVNKANDLSVISSDKTSQSVDCEGIKDKESSIWTKSNQYQQKISSEHQTKTKKELRDDIIRRTDTSKITPVDSKIQEEYSSSNVVVATPPQFQHSCPVCHKVSTIKVII